MVRKYDPAIFNIKAIILPEYDNIGALFVKYNGGFRITDFKQEVVRIKAHPINIKDKTVGEINVLGESNKYLNGIVNFLSGKNFPQEPPERPAKNSSFYLFPEDIISMYFDSKEKLYLARTIQLKPSFWGVRPEYNIYKRNK